MILHVVCPSLQCRVSTYVWLLLGYPILAVVHCLACVLSWLLIFTIPVAKINARTMTTVLLMAPEDVQIHRQEKVRSHFLRFPWSVKRKMSRQGMCVIFYFPHIFFFYTADFL